MQLHLQKPLPSQSQNEIVFPLRWKKMQRANLASAVCASEFPEPAIMAWQFACLKFDAPFHVTLKCAKRPVQPPVQACCTRIKAFIYPSPPMKIEQHAVLNAVTRAIILCDSDPQEAQEGLYALGDYLKYYFAAIGREGSPATAQDMERVAESLDALHLFLKGRPGA